MFTYIPQDKICQFTLFCSSLHNLGL